MPYAEQGDILQIKAFSTVQGRECLNVFHYRVNPFAVIDPTSNLPELALTWANAYRELVMTSLSINTRLYRVIVENLTDGAQFTDQSVNLFGAVSQDEMPSFVSIGVTLRRATKLTRNGSKRFAGVCELSVVNGAMSLTAGQKGNMETFCGQIPELSGVNQPTVKYNLDVVIVGRSLVNGEYVLDLSKVNNVLNAQVNARATTQNTRKS